MNRKNHQPLLLEMDLPRQIIRPRLANPIRRTRHGPLHLANRAKTRTHQDELPLPRPLQQQMRQPKQPQRTKRVDLEIAAQRLQRRGPDGAERIRTARARVGDDDVDARESFRRYRAVEGHSGVDVGAEDEDGERACWVGREAGELVLVCPLPLDRGENSRVRTEKEGCCYSQSDP